VEANIESNSEFVAASYSVTATLTKDGKTLDMWAHSQPDSAAESPMQVQEGGGCRGPRAIGVTVIRAG